MVMPHVCEKIHSIGVVLNIRIIDDAQCIQLVTKCLLADHELCRIGPVEAVDAIGPHNSLLNLQLVSIIAVPENSSLGHKVVCNCLQTADDILISAFRSSAHIKLMMLDPLAVGKKLV